MRGSRAASVLALAASALLGLCSVAFACPPGSGGANCSFGMKTLFYNHSVYENITKHPRDLDLQGWSVTREIYDELVNRTNATLIIEVGVWKGKSAAHLATNLLNKQSGVLFAVDTWLGALEFWNRRFSNGAFDRDRDLMWENGYPTVYLTFLSNMVQLNLSSYVVPFPVPSRLAGEFFREKGLLADLIHIDAAHEYEDVGEDIKLWWPLVRPCGILFGDDYPGWEGVRRAVDEWGVKANITIENRSPKWVATKPC